MDVDDSLIGDAGDLLRLLEYLDRRRIEAHRRRLLGIKPGSVVHHLDRDPWNNDPSNLVIMDPKENQQ